MTEKLYTTQTDLDTLAAYWRGEYQKLLMTVSKLKQQVAALRTDGSLFGTKKTNRPRVQVDYAPEPPDTFAEVVKRQRAGAQSVRHSLA